MRYNSKFIKVNIFSCVFFIIIAIVFNLQLLSSGRITTVSDFISSGIMDESYRYINSRVVIGIICTMLFIFVVSQRLNIINAVYLVRYNRDGFVKQIIFQMFESAVIFSFEYIFIYIVSCIIVCDFSVLIDVNFFPCVLLLFVSLIEYFTIVGILTLVIQYVLKFSNIYIAASIILFCAANHFSNVMDLNISLTDFFNFVTNFIENGIFNRLDYLINIIETIIICFILSYIARLLFLKRDLIIDE